MEIMLAIMILAIVVTTVLASFNAVFSTTGVLDRSTEIYGEAQNCLGRMITDLESIYVLQPPLYKPPAVEGPPDPYRVVGARKDVGGMSFATFRFTSRAHLHLGKSRRGGIAAITYYVQARDDGQKVLRRADNLYPYPPFEEKGSDPALCEHVKSLAFKYFDRQGEEHDTWDSDSEEFGYATPAAVAVLLELEVDQTSYPFETMVRLPDVRGKIQ